MLRSLAAGAVLVASACSEAGTGEIVDDRTPAERVERSRLEDDVVFIAQERVPGSAHWQVVQDLCAERFEAAGLAVERHDYGTGINVAGVLEGTERPGERVLISGHYDHIPGCNGADDNASGVAAVLEAARVMGGGDYPRTAVFVCWDEEETGLVGSRAYAERAVREGEDIVVVYSLDPVGYASDEPGSQTMPDGFSLAFPDLWEELEAREFRGDWLGVVADEPVEWISDLIIGHAADAELDAGALIMEDWMLASSLFDDLRRSDHAPFWDVGVSAIELGDTGEFRNPGYHCRNGPDDPDTVNYRFLEQVTRATVGSVLEVLRAPAE
jgi:hypothetical protein